MQQHNPLKILQNLGEGVIHQFPPTPLPYGGAEFCQIEKNHSPPPPPSRTLTGTECGGGRGRKKRRGDTAHTPHRELIHGFLKCFKATIAFSQRFLTNSPDSAPTLLSPSPRPRGLSKAGSPPRPRPRAPCDPRRADPGPGIPHALSTSQRPDAPRPGHASHLDVVVLAVICHPFQIGVTVEEGPAAPRDFLLQQHLQLRHLHILLLLIQTAEVAAAAVPGKPKAGRGGAAATAAAATREERETPPARDRGGGSRTGAGREPTDSEDGHRGDGRPGARTRAPLPPPPSARKKIPTLRRAARPSPTFGVS